MHAFILPNPQYNISSFVVLQRPPHSMVLSQIPLTEHSEARDPSGCLKNKKGGDGGASTRDPHP